MDNKKATYTVVCHPDPIAINVTYWQNKFVWYAQAGEIVMEGSNKYEALGRLVSKIEHTGREAMMGSVNDGK